MKIYRSLLLFSLVALVAATGCIFSPDDDKDPPPSPPGPTYRAPTHPDSVTANFQDIYADQNINAYRDMLDPDYKFILKEEIGGDSFYNFDTEISITDNIFAGREGTNGEPPISSISITMSSLGDWQPILPDDPNFGGVTGQWRSVQMNMFMERRSPATSFVIQGESLFYVKQVQANGRTEYRLYGIVDRTNG